MAQAPAKHNHDEPAPRPTHEAAKTVGQPGSLVLPLAEAGGPPLVGATGVTGEHIEDGERDPHTIAEEQRRRSEDYENRIGDKDQSRLSPHDRTNQEQDALQHDPNPGRSQQHDAQNRPQPKK